MTVDDAVDVFVSMLPFLLLWALVVLGVAEMFRKDRRGDEPTVMQHHTTVWLTAQRRHQRNLKLLGTVPRRPEWRR